MKTWSSIALSIMVGLFFTKASAQSPEPFKLGTLQRGNETFVGLVLGDSVVVNIARANAALERVPGAAKVGTPRI